MKQENRFNSWFMAVNEMVDSGLDPLTSEAPQVALLLEAFEKGEVIFAENKASELCKKFPNLEVAWKILAVLRLQSGREFEALKPAMVAVDLNPLDSASQNILGLIQQKLGSLQKAINCFRSAIACDENFVEAHNNLGNVYQDLGDFESAGRSYTDALALRPDYPEALFNAGIVSSHFGRIDEAINFYTAAIELKPNYSKALNNLGILFQNMGDLKSAEACFRKVLLVSPRSEEVFINLANLLISASRFHEALDLLAQGSGRRVAELKLNCLYQLDDRSRFLKQLDQLLSKEQPNAVLGSFTSRAAARYDVKRTNIFCERPLDLIHVVDLSSICDFERLFVSPCKALLKDEATPKRWQGLLKNGDQTYGNIFDLKPDLTRGLREAIVSQVDAFRQKFCDSHEGLISLWPDQYHLMGWLVSMRSGGELRPHIHENGWISGSVYINVPPKKTADAGSLVVCIEEAQLDADRNYGEVIDTCSGTMCLFPSSLMHYTVPFDSSSDRIVLAFDVIPD